jgi:hypothetical protein
LGNLNLANAIHIPLAGNFQNHMNYQHSNQLNAPTTATTDIDPATFGPTEYFKMKNTDNIYAKLQGLIPNNPGLDTYRSPFINRHKM